jgi:acetolactate synthase-1/2/3 large subunit
MKLSDYVAIFLAEQGIKHVFGLTGGAVVHLFDSVARNSGIRPIFTHHEQAAAMAAEAYSRVRNGVGAAMVTTGPGGTNAITGVCAAWLDSVPCIYISGQARLAHTTRGKAVRQVGAQQLDIVPLVAPITKYAVMVDDPNMIKYELQKALHIATSDRPGPVWIDLPLDLQWASIEPDELPGFDPGRTADRSSSTLLESQVRKVLELFDQAERPIILAGYGIRLAHAEAEFRRLIELLKVPFLSSWNASDLLPTDNQFYVGRPGIFGQRGANLAIQNCDLLLSLGSHLCLTITGTMFHAFARKAKIVMVDVDPVELEHRTVRVDVPVQCDAKRFLQEMLRQAKRIELNRIGPWRDKCSQYGAKYNVVRPTWRDQKDYVNAYTFVDSLSNALDNHDVVVVDGGGTINQVAFQAFRVKDGQRLIISGGLCAMGSGLPESVGACFGADGARTICLCGDGSLQLNIQELQTIVHHRLPVKIFVINNGGYLSIRNTQDGFLGSNYVGSRPSGGMSLPDFVKLGQAYGLMADRVHHHGELEEKIRRALEEPGPVINEIMISPQQDIAPRQGFDPRPDGTHTPRPLEDMYPYLDRSEFLKNMIVDPWVDPAV